MTIPVYNSCDRIIRFAMEDAGLLEDGQDPTPDQSGRYMQRLNDLINTKMIQGLKLFIIEDYALTAPILQQGVYLYSFGPTGTVAMTKPLRVEDAYYADSNGVRRPLLPMARNDWDRLSTVTSQGAINQYFEDKQQFVININLWPAPSANAATGTVHIVFRTQITNFVTVNDVIMFPVEWFLYLRWALADELSTGQPDSVVQRNASKAKMYSDMLDDWDVEDAPTEFQPDPQMGYGQSRFR